MLSVSVYVSDFRSVSVYVMCRYVESYFLNHFYNEVYVMKIMIETKWCYYESEIANIYH